MSLFKCSTRDTGSFVSRNNYSKCRIREIGVIVSNDSKCRTRETGSLSLGIMIPIYNQGDRSHLSLGIVIITVEPGGLGSFVSRNTDYI